MDVNLLVVRQPIDRCRMNSKGPGSGLQCSNLLCSMDAWLANQGFTFRGHSTTLSYGAMVVKRFSLMTRTALASAFSCRRESSVLATGSMPFV